jgi:hypothetical protein
VRCFAYIWGKGLTDNNLFINVRKNEVNFYLIRYFLQNQVTLYKYSKETKW